MRFGTCTRIEYGGLELDGSLHLSPGVCPFRTGLCGLFLYGHETGRDWQRADAEDRRSHQTGCHGVPETTIHGHWGLCRRPRDHTRTCDKSVYRALFRGGCVPLGTRGVHWNVSRHPCQRQDDRGSEERHRQRVPGLVCERYRHGTHGSGTWTARSFGSVLPALQLHVFRYDQHRERALWVLTRGQFYCSLCTCWWRYLHQGSRCGCGPCR